MDGGTFSHNMDGVYGSLKLMGKNTAARLFSKTVAPVLKGLVGTIMKIITKALTWIGKKHMLRQLISQLN